MILIEAAAVVTHVDVNPPIEHVILLVAVKSKNIKYASLSVISSNKK
ncbi:hypothetical protein [Legionella parisiensis]|nr:hypothetical protein [Legionella parisiensis]